MKIAFTADLHLTTQSRNPERFQTLADILRQCGKNEIQLLVIAGDLFDQNLPNYAELERLYRAHRPRELRTIIIPGNHDSSLKAGQLVSDGLTVFSEPVLQPLNDSRKILFLPYQAQQTMGEAIAPFAEQLRGERWILVSHGDWAGGVSHPDPYETGTYMPLTRTDLQRYQPEVVFLGHIHLPQSSAGVWYPGSPCPLNSSETGLRRFLIFNTSTGEISSHLVDTPLVYFREHFVMLPLENDLDLLKRDIAARISGWNLPAGWKDRLRLRVEIAGTALSERAKVLSAITAAFEGYHFADSQGPAIDSLSHSSDPDRSEIARLFITWLEGLELDPGPRQPTRDQILEAGLRIIYQAV